MPREAATADVTPRVVKAGSAGPLGTPVAFNYADLRRACDDHLSDVRERSQRLIGDASSEAERIRRDAAEEGRREGRREGLKAAEAEVAVRVDRLTSERVATELETVLPAVRRLSEEIRGQKDAWAARWEAEAVRLAVAIAEKLLRRIIEVDSAAADPLIADTLRLAVGTPQLTVRLSPTDHERLGGSIDTLVETVGKLGATEVVSDSAVEPGGCVVESAHGRIDGRLTTQLDRITSELIG